ncbi:MAG: hypothetical protein QOJ03_1613 [Frankiaceae bacterium]|nr:hypothetical protein [Frankiaceae bacterium]
MDRLEQELRDLLTDERLDVRVPPGAVSAVHDGVRRRKHRRAIATSAAAAFVVFAALGTSVVATRGLGDDDAVLPGGDNSPTTSAPPTSSPTPTVGPAPVPTAGTATIGWNALPYDARRPIELPGTVADTSVPWCTAKTMTVTMAEFQGATGSAASSVVLTNDGAACALQGPPAITGYDAHDTAVALTSPADDFVVHPWFRVEPGQRATASVQIVGDRSRCELGPVTRVTVDLGHGGRLATTDVSGVGGGDVKPRCGTAPATQQVDHYAVSSGDWTRPDGTPTLSLNDQNVTIGHAPTTVMQGTVVHFQVLLSGTAPTDPCLPFREQLTSLDTARTVLAREDHLLDCRAIRAAPDTTSYALEMQLALPADVPTGMAQLAWETALPGQVASDGPTIRITAAPAQCRKDQLAVTAGGGMGGQMHIHADYFVFTNTSKSTCSLHGFPGVQLIGANGHGMPTRDSRVARGPFWNDAIETIVLTPRGGTASFGLAGANFDGAGATCPTTQGIKFIPPNLTIADQLYVADAWPYCQRGRLDVSPVVAGSRGPR